MAAKTFNQIQFQDEVIRQVRQAWHRRNRTAKLITGRARAQLRRLGYTMEQSYAIVDDAVDVAALQEGWAD